jgi:DNA-binding transcriptional regulator YiaG
MPIKHIQKVSLAKKVIQCSVLKMAEDFASRIKKWRMELKLRPKEAAAVFDVPTGTYRTWEKGSRTPHKLAMAEIVRRMEGAK